MYQAFDLEVIFDNINFTKLFDVYLTRRPDFPVAKPLFEDIPVQDRHGTLTRKIGYDSDQIELQFRFVDEYNVKQKMRSIVSWLNGKRKFVLSDDETVYRTIQRIDFSNVTNNIKQMADFVVTLKVEPFWYEDDGIVIIEDTDQHIITNPSSEEAKTYIEIFGEGQCEVIINGETIRMTDVQGSVVVDGILEEAYDHLIGRNNNMSGKYPILISGDNVVQIAENTTKVEIHKRWCWR